jgi:hypothetical protein
MYEITLTGAWSYLSWAIAARVHSQLLVELKKTVNGPSEILEE